MLRRGWLALGLLLTCCQASAVTKDLDFIVAIVDDDVVLASELVSRLDAVRKQMKAAKMQIPPSNVLFNQMLERLIMEDIQLQMGERAGVRIDDESLTAAIESIAKQNKMTLAQFTQALASEGIDYREFREDVRREMIIQRVQRNRVNHRIYISDEEIDAFLASPLGQSALSDEYRVGHILIAVAGRRDAGGDRGGRAEGGRRLREAEGRRRLSRDGDRELGRFAGARRR